MPAALSLAVAVMLLGWLLFAPLHAAGSAAPDPGSNAAVAVADGGKRSPDDLHYPVVRKKHRRTELAPVAFAAAPRVAPRPAAGGWIALAGTGLADAGSETRPAAGSIDRGPAQPSAPQLRLRPSQAPPAG